MNTSFELKKVEFEKGVPRSKAGCNVLISRNRLTICGEAVAKMGWTPGMRVDLLQGDTVFALEPSPAGLFLLKRPNGCARTLVISSTPLCRHIRVTTHGDCRMRASKSGKRLLFFEEGTQGDMEE